MNRCPNDRQSCCLRDLFKPALVLAVLTWALIAPATSHALSNVTPERLSPYFTPQTVAFFDDYLRPAYVMAILQDVVHLIFWFVLLGLKLNVRLMDRCNQASKALLAKVQRPAVTKVTDVLTKLWGGEGWLGAMLFVLAYLTAERLLFFPGSFWFNWVRERAWGYSVQSLPSFMWDWTKGFALEALAKGSLVFGLFGLTRRMSKWWLVLGVPCALLMVVSGFLDPYRTQIYRDYLPLPEGQTRQAIERTLKLADVEYENVMALKMGKITTRVNAFIAGEGPSRRIVLYDTLMAAMTDDEIANAVAHELGHLKDRSWIRRLLGSILIIPLLWLFALTLRRLGKTGRLGFDDDRDVRALPAIFALLFALETIQSIPANAMSRYYENRADEYALNLLHQPEAFRSMMVKLAMINGGDLHPPIWMQLLWKTHPLTVDRVAHAESFAHQYNIPMKPPTPELFALPPHIPMAGQKKHQVHPEGNSKDSNTLDSNTLK